MKDIDLHAHAQSKLLRFQELARHHYDSCPGYKAIVDRYFTSAALSGALEDLPFLPAEVFKTHALKSIDENAVFKVLKSSGTTSQQRSQIYLDRDTARAQSKALSDIVATVLGKKRRPMLVIDSPAQIANRASFSARGAGILGFSAFGSKTYFALNDDMSLNHDRIDAFLSHAADQMFIFGFTAIIWQEFLSKISPGMLADVAGSAVLLHGGGWKKLAAQNISSQAFIATVKERLPFVKSVHDYYGMVEQTGSIFLGNETGYLETNAYNDIICRDQVTLAPLPDGQVGVLQVLSTLPTSYPGFSILTEDVGRIIGKSDAGADGQSRKIFEVHGRMAQAEVRGCSDTYQGR